MHKHLSALTTFFCLSTSLAYGHDNDSPSHTHHDEQQGITVHEVRVKTTPPGINNSAIYLRLINHSDTSVALLKADSNVAQHTEVHTHHMQNGLMRMHKVNKVMISAGETLDFKPGGYHIMLIGLKQAITYNDTVDVELTFSDGTKKHIKAMAKKATEKTGSNTHHHHIPH